MQVQSIIFREKGKHITFETRQTMEYILHQRYLKKNKLTNKEIYTQLGISKATFYRELSRGMVTQLDYNYNEYRAYSAVKAQQEHDYLASGKGPQLKIGSDFNLISMLEHLIIEEKFSPYAALQQLILSHQLTTSICLKTLYNYIHQDIFPNLEMKFLPRRGAKAKVRKQRVTTTPTTPSKSIIHRPKAAEERNQLGHMEMDCILSGNTGHAALLTIIDRTSRYCFIRWMPDHTQKSVIEALDSIERELGSELFTTLFNTTTADNGPEFRNDTLIEQSCLDATKTRTTIYYCHPYASCERGTNEQLNGLIRRFVKKGSRIEDYSIEFIHRLEEWYNNYPRKVLGGNTPKMVLETLLNGGTE